MANSDETRELVKRLVRERLVEKVGVGHIVYCGEEIEVATDEDGHMRINLPRLKKSYAVISGRVYEREYADSTVMAVSVDDEQYTIVEQLDYRGNPEKVDTSDFSNKLICKCGGIRYVKKQDLFQVTKCKPCTMRERKARRRKAA